MQVLSNDAVGWKSFVPGSEIFKVSCMDLSVQNLARHALMADVPVQAVDKVTFHVWDGLVESSLIAHRLGQLPVKGLEPVSFDVDVTAALDAPLTWVTTDDITGDDGRVVRGTEDGIGSGFLLVPLLGGQRAKLTCHTSLGTGRRHAVWNSVFPVVQRDERGDVTFIVETTGAVTPREAWLAALTSTRDLFMHIASLQCKQACP